MYGKGQGRRDGEIEVLGCHGFSHRGTGLMQSVMVMMVRWWCGFDCLVSDLCTDWFWGRGGYEGEIEGLRAGMVAFELKW